jgi:hypothetical protein
MAPEAPDPQSLKSWHDAFQYPIPTVRRVEQELRRDIASNKEKLRALVGQVIESVELPREMLILVRVLIERDTAIWSELPRQLWL